MSTALATLTKNLATRFDIDASNSQELMDTLKQTAFKVKDTVVSDAQMTALMIVAQQYGLNPWVKEIYAYPDKGAIVPVVGVDGWSRIINDNPQFDGVEFTYSQETTTFKGKVVHEWIECRIYRKDRSHPTMVREYFDEVARELSYANPWNTHPKRMHRHKSLIQCGRIAFGYGGIYDQDEAERIVESHQEVDVQTGEVVDKPKNDKPILPILSDDDFNKIAYDVYDEETGDIKKHGWKFAVECGKKTNDQVISIISTRNTLTESQIKTIKSWEKVNA